MTRTIRHRRRHALAITALASVSMALGGGLVAASAEEEVTITWWHIQNNDPGLSDWQSMADAFMADHPNVTIEITAMENDAFSPHSRPQSRPATFPTCSSRGAGACCSTRSRRARFKTSPRR